MSLGRGGGVLSAAAEASDDAPVTAGTEHAFPSTSKYTQKTTRPKRQKRRNIEHNEKLKFALDEIVVLFCFQFSICFNPCVNLLSVS